MSQWGISVAESNGRDVNIARFSNWLKRKKINTNEKIFKYLMIASRVVEDQKSRFHILFLNLIGEGTRGVTTSNSLGSSVLGELQDSTLTVIVRGDGTDILWVFYGNDNTGSKNELFPSLLEVDDVDTLVLS